MKALLNFPDSSEYNSFYNNVPISDIGGNYYKPNVVSFCKTNKEIHYNKKEHIIPIEYLQNTVGAFIILPYMPNNNIGHETKWCKANTANVEIAPIGCWTAWANTMWGEDYKQTQTKILVAWGNSNKDLSTSTYPANNFVIWRRVGTNFYINGSNVTTNAAYTFQSTRNISLFGINVDGATPNYNQPMKIAYAKIFNINTNENIFDLIPVRINQDGYMYDKVSGQLFGNSGSGNFILGPDL